MKRVSFLLLIACYAVLLPFAAENESTPIAKKFIVGVKEAAPFSMKGESGDWSGLSIDLWKEIARELQINYEFREMDLQHLLDGVASKQLDAVVAAVTISPEREERMDFTHPFHTSGLGIAVPVGQQGKLFGVIKRFFSLEFFKVFLFLLLLLMSVGTLVWFFERRGNPDQFGGANSHGILSGLWWSAVTMTTVGYGDKAPVTLGGRIVALVWMFASIVIISGVTAAITSALTIDELQSSIRSPKDLAKVRVATISGSTSQNYLQRNQIRTRLYETPLDALQAVAAKRIDAFVYDAPILRYLAATKLDDPVQVLPFVVERQDYGIALYQGCEYREPINRELLRVIHQPSWQNTLFLYLGDRDE